MRRIASIFVLILFVLANNHIYSHSYVPRRSMDFNQIMIGMKSNQVIEILGQPYKKEKRFSSEAEYEVLYFPNGNSIYQTRYADKNFIPLIFYKETLQGWGWSYFKRIFDIREGRFKTQNVRYTKSRRQIEEMHETQVLNNNQVMDSHKEETQNKQVENALNNFIQETVVQPVDSSKLQSNAVVPSKEAVKETKPVQEAKLTSQVQTQVSPVQSTNSQQVSASVEAVKETKPVQEAKQTSQVQTQISPVQPASSQVSSSVEAVKETKPVQEVKQASQVQAQVSTVQPASSIIQPKETSVETKPAQEIKPVSQAVQESVKVEQNTSSLPKVISNLVEPKVELKAIKPQASKREIPVIEIVIHSNTASVQPLSNAASDNKVEVKILNPQSENSQKPALENSSKDLKNTSLENTSACIFKIMKQDELTKINEAQFELRVTLYN